MTTVLETQDLHFKQHPDGRTITITLKTPGAADKVMEITSETKISVTYYDPDFADMPDKPN